jgi:prepilin-type processing-associated H-X9-DG protein
MGILNDMKINGNQLLCPEAQDRTPFTRPLSGSGMAFNAWSGQFQTTSTGVKGDNALFINNTGSMQRDPATGSPAWGFRVGSYGQNRNLLLNPQNGGIDGYKNWYNLGSSYIAGVKSSAEVPLFYDSIWIDNQGMNNGTVSNGVVTAQPPVPTDLTGLSASDGVSGHDQDRFLIKRHGRAINICFADGHAQTVPLEETTNYIWFVIKPNTTPPVGWARFVFSSLKKVQ